MFVNLSTVLLQAQPQAGGSMVSLLFMVGMIVVFYFFLIRPQAKRAKEQKKFADTIGVGEKVITNSGIHGTITRLNDDGTMQLEIGRAQFVIMERSAISMEMTAAYRKRTTPAAAAATTEAAATK